MISTSVHPRHTMFRVYTALAFGVAATFTAATVMHAQESTPSAASTSASAAGTVASSAFAALVREMLEHGSLASLRTLTPRDHA